MPHIKPKSLHPQRGTGYHASFLGIGDGAVLANDIVIASGYSGERIKFKKADANTTPLASGVMGIADHTVADGGTLRVVSHKLITGVDTSASTAAGYPVYLSETAGEWTTAPAGPIVGTVVSDHASTGAVLLSITHTSNDSLSGIAYGASTSLIQGSAFNTDLTLVQPAGTMLIDAGIVLTVAIAGSSGNTTVSVGTASGGAQICAGVDFISSATAGAIGSAHTVSGAQGEGATALAFVADAALYSAAERNVFVRIACSAQVTAGTARPFIRFVSI